MYGYPWVWSLAVLAAAMMAPMGRAGEKGSDAVTVDLAAEGGPVSHRACGFLHSMSATQPVDKWLEPLHPRLFRAGPYEWTKGIGAFATYARYKKLGARVQLVVSDAHCYALAGWWPGDGGDWRRWEGAVEALVRQAQTDHYTFEWDLWNEPNIKYFWGQDRAQFFETWRRTFRQVRAVDPKALIVGPSLAGYDERYLEAFLVYAQKNCVLPDVLTYHEFEHRKLAEHVAALRRLLAKHHISIPRIALNEMIGAREQYQPGAAVWYLAEAERAKVDGACHACWMDRGTDNGATMSLDGLLTPEGLPRPVWWVYQSYGRMTGRLIALKPHGSITGMASVNAATGTILILLGRDGGEQKGGAVRLCHLDQAGAINRGGKVRITAERIPDLNGDSLARPLPVLDAEYVLEGPALTLKLPGFGPTDAYVLRLQAEQPSTSNQ